MSNFWATKLGVAPQPAATQVPNPGLVGRYSPSPYFTPSAPVQAPLETEEASGDLTVAQALHDPSARPTKALSAKLNDQCPDCGSGNIFSPVGQPNMMPQCYECGWNPRFAQMTAGGGLPSGEATTATPARQMNPKGTSNFHPETIVAKVSL